VKRRLQSNLATVISLLALVLAVGGGRFAVAQVGGATQSLQIPAGTIASYGGSGAPNGWLVADGSEVSRIEYPLLFQAIGETYGAGNGSTTFRLPDLRGRVLVGVDGSAGRLGSNDALSQTGGEERHSLTVGEMPSHAHGAYTASNTAWPNIGNVTTPGFMTKISIDDPNVFSPGSTVDRGDVTLESTGGGQAHNNMQPYQVVTHIIKY
jgi:microcystin-dependent protein